MEKTSEEPPSKNKKGGRKISLLEPQRQIGAFFIEKRVKIRSDFNEKGIQIFLNQKKFEIPYPKNFWLRHPQFFKRNLANTLAFLSTIHLPYLLDTECLDYQICEPPTKNLLLEGFIKSLPSTALMKSEKTSKLMERFSQTKLGFLKTNKKNRRILKFSQKNQKESALLAFSFGKDSLLTFSLCQELGVNAFPIYVEEPLTDFENYHKKILAKKFFNEFKQKIIFLKNETGAIRESGKNSWFGWELQLTQFGLISLPIALSKNIKYLFFANEQSCNENFLDEDGFLCNPVYEQSIEWMLKFRKIINLLGVKNLFVGSLVEPLYEIAIMKILHSRYPEIAKYQMSCGEDIVKEKKYRWCGNCSKCARIYIFLLANGVDPKKVEFPNDMLKMKFKNKFSLFDEEGGNYGYDKSGLGRDEQLLAFLLAYQKGAKGELIDIFKKTYLKEAEKREKELREKFFGIHSFVTVPKELRKKISKIYHEELKDLR